MARKKRLHQYDVTVISRHSLKKQNIRTLSYNMEDARKEAKRDYGKVLKVKRVLMS